MSEKPQSSAGDQDESRAGQRLAAARKSKDISIFEIAKELHLDEHKVQALEENRFDVLGAPVFAKGHLRKYAQLVGVSVDDIMADYYTMHRSTGAPPVVGAVRKQPSEFSFGPWLLVVVAIALAAAAYWFWPAGTAIDADDVPDEPQVGAPARTPVEPAAAETSSAEMPANQEPAESDDTSAPDDNAEPEPSPAPQTSPLAADSAVPSADPESADTVTFTLAFSGDCWTEISDASGERLFFGLGAAGRTVNLSGEAPISVLLGDSDNVALTVNGEDFPIQPSMRRGRTARFTLVGQ